MPSNFYVGGVSAPNDIDSLYLTNSDVGWTTPPTGFVQVWGSAANATGWNAAPISTVPLYPGNTWKDISTVGIGSSFATVAIKTDGSLWAVGSNGFGQLGLGDVATRSSFAPVGSLNNWASISLKQSFVLAVKTDGTLWAWGANGSGQLGDGTIANKSSPVQIGSLTDWATVSAGNSESYAIKTDGTLWAWGANSAGQIGDNTIVSKSSPVQIGSLTDWATVSAGALCVAALKTDGTLWTWGTNGQGQLGVGTIASKSSPVQVGSDNTWMQATMANTSLLLLKSDNTLWSCGQGTSTGVNGRGATGSSSSPIQVGLLTDWASVYSNGSSVIAIKTDNTLWGWSATGVYCGDNTSVPKSSPVQIGSLNNWSLPISAGSGAGFVAYSKS